MTMMAFHLLFPEEAETETLQTTPVDNDRLPRRGFVFVESYCCEPMCDCRRVMIQVHDTESHKDVATINYGFEPPGPLLADYGQMFLDPLNPQSELSEAFLDLFEEMIERDGAYRDRLVRHYRMWKQIIDDPEHPGQEEMRAVEAECGIFRRREPARRTGSNTGVNKPCPCGSDRRYKDCCLN